MSQNYNNMNNKAMNQYRQNQFSDIEHASPHRLVQLLINGVLEKLLAAKGYMKNGDIEQKGKYISWAISIIDHLRASLDMDSGDAIAGNLYDLYNYMESRLFEANMNNQPEIIDEVAKLMLEVKRAWDDIPQEFHNGMESQHK